MYSDIGPTCSDFECLVMDLNVVSSPLWINSNDHSTLDDFSLNV